MRHYEVVAVIHPDQQGRIAAMIELYKKIVTDGGGVLHRLEDWGRRPLAYPIQNQQKAQYILMNIECGNDTLDKLRETFRFSDSIIRSIVVRREHAITEPSVVMKQEKKREESAEDGAGAKSAPSENGRGRESSATAADSSKEAAAKAASAESAPASEKAPAADSSESAPAVKKPRAKKAASAESTPETEKASAADSSESAPVVKKPRAAKSTSPESTPETEKTPAAESDNTPAKEDGSKENDK